MDAYIAQDLMRSPEVPETLTRTAAVRVGSVGYIDIELCGADARMLFEQMCAKDEAIEMLFVANLCYGHDDNGDVVITYRHSVAGKATKQIVLRFINQPVMVAGYYVLE